MRREVIRLTDEQKEMLAELRSYQDRGCSICLNGRPSVPGEIVAACFRENSVYMRDIVSDDNSVIRKINFVKIRKNNKPL